MGIKWNPDFDRSEHEQKAAAGSASLLRKTGAIKYVKQVKKPRPTFVQGTKPSSAHHHNAATRDFVFPGALVKLVGHSKKLFNASFCTVVSISHNFESTETVRYGKWWDCILPDGRTMQVNSADMRPIEVQNGNINTEEEE